MHDLFERAGEFASAVVADTPADLGDAQAFFFQQQLCRQIHAVIRQPRADGRAVDRTEARLHRRHRDVEAARVAPPA